MIYDEEDQERVTWAIQQRETNLFLHESALRYGHTLSPANILSESVVVYQLHLAEQLVELAKERYGGEWEAVEVDDAPEDWGYFCEARIFGLDEDQIAEELVFEIKNLLSDIHAMNAALNGEIIVSFPEFAMHVREAGASILDKELQPTSFIGKKPDNDAINLNAKLIRAGIDGWYDNLGIQVLERGCHYIGSADVTGVNTKSKRSETKQQAGIYEFSMPILRRLIGSELIAEMKRFADKNKDSTFHSVFLDSLLLGLYLLRQEFNGDLETLMNEIESKRNLKGPLINFSRPLIYKGFVELSNHTEITKLLTRTEDSLTTEEMMKNLYLLFGKQFEQDA